MQKIIDTLIAQNKLLTDKGVVASYIPELDKANKNALGVYVLDKERKAYFAGDYQTKLPCRVFLRLSA